MITGGKQEMMRINDKNEFLLNYFRVYRTQIFTQEAPRSRFNIGYRKKRQYEKEWSKLHGRYRKIRLYELSFIALGETIFRIVNMVTDFTNCESDVLNIAIPSFSDKYHGGVFNNSIFSLFEKKLYFITEQNIDFWEYVARYHFKELDFKEIRKYSIKRGEIYKINQDSPFILLEKSIENKAREKMKKMGIKNQFICLHARDSGVKSDTLGSGFAYESSCRECDINTFQKACEYMQKGYGVQSVRMGKYEKRICQIPGVIDYAKNYWEDYMDFYLISKCKFMLGSLSGLTSITGFLGRPVLITNVCCSSYGFESCPVTGMDLYIPKKFWSEKDGRYLNLYETLDIANLTETYMSNYDRLGIVLVNNTQDEILEAVKEINDRLDNRWIESEKEKQYMEKYWKIMNTWKARHSFVYERRYARRKEYIMNPYPISFYYLEKNLYLLDVDLENL